MRRLVLIVALLVGSGCSSIPQRDWSTVNSTTPPTIPGSDLTERIAKVRNALAQNGVSIDAHQLDCYVAAILARYGVSGLDSVVEPAAITPALFHDATIALNTCLKS